MVARTDLSVIIWSYFNASYGPINNYINLWNEQNNKNHTTYLKKCSQTYSFVHLNNVW